MKSENTNEIIDSNISNTSKIYFRAKIQNSMLSENTVVGDFSRVVNSELASFARIDRNNFILNSQFGDYSYTGSNDIIMHSVIGKFCSISWGVTIGPGEHDYSKISSHDFLYNNFCEIRPIERFPKYNRFEKECKIGNDVWIGANSTILRGVTIGDGAVVGANSLVNKNVPPYAIVAGVPARIIKYRFPVEIISELQELEWWNLPIEIIKTNFDLFEKSDISNAIFKLKEIKSKL